MPPNPFILASDNSPSLVPLLRANPSLASAQDEHGYSLLHAAASYNHLELLRVLVREFHVPIDLRDEDAETALFVVETIEAATILVEDLGLDPGLRNNDSLTAKEKIESEGDFPDVAEYLSQREERLRAASALGSNVHSPNGILNAQAEAMEPALELPPPPEGLQVTVGTMSEPEAIMGEADPEFRRRIEELAAREDFDSAEGQAELRQLIQDAVSNQNLGDDRNMRRPRQS